MSYRVLVESTGLRELRQNASELIRRVEAGESFTVTVSGRAVAELGPARSRSWRTWTEAADVFTGPGDPDWYEDRDLVDGSIADPFTR